MKEKEIIVEEGTSLWQDSWARLSKNKAAMVGLIVIAIITLISIITPWVAPYSYEEQNLTNALARPSLEHWLGTDNLGRDLFTRILYGGRISLMVGFIATFISVIIGVSYGAISGYFGGRVDAIMMRVVEILYALPFTFLVIILMVVFGRNFLLLFFALGAISWLTLARMVRGQIMSLRKREYVEAAFSLGLKERDIIFKHLVPNVLGVVAVYSTLTIPVVILEEAFLSFIGLGVQPPMSSWGILIADGVKYLEEAPFVIIFPGITLSVTLFALNFLGDGLRDALDPRSSKD